MQEAWKQNDEDIVFYSWWRLWHKDDVREYVVRTTRRAIDLNVAFLMQILYVLKVKFFKVIKLKEDAVIILNLELNSKV